MVKNVRVRMVRVVRVVVVACLAFLMSTPDGHAAPAQLLPDLRQAPVGCPGGYSGNLLSCDDWDVCEVANAAGSSGPCVTSGQIGAVRLRFTTAEENIGSGPLLIYGHRAADPATPDMQVRQALAVAGSDALPQTFGAAQHQVASTMYYEPAAMHQHWHLLDFEHFQLRTLAGGNLVLDQKNGVCLGDRYQQANANALAATPRGDATATGRLHQFLGPQNCDFKQPGATDVTEGISVGSGDDYTYDVDFQWLDITRVPSGTYDVTATVDGTHALAESNYANNSSSIAVSIQWPGGAAKPPAVITAPPTVKLLNSCPGSASCLG